LWIDSRLLIFFLVLRGIGALSRCLVLQIPAACCFPVFITSISRWTVILRPFFASFLLFFFFALSVAAFHGRIPFLFSYVPGPLIFLALQLNGLFVCLILFFVIRDPLRPLLFFGNVARFPSFFRVQHVRYPIDPVTFPPSFSWLLRSCNSYTFVTGIFGLRPAYCRRRQCLTMLHVRLVISNFVVLWAAQLIPFCPYCRPSLKGRSVASLVVAALFKSFAEMVFFSPCGSYAFYSVFSVFSASSAPL